jgi:hypothetical protein
MGKLVKVTADGYACWASYLVNGDASGISEEDKVAADEFAEWLGGSIVCVGEETHFGRPSTGGLPGDVVEYTSLVDEDIADAGEGK